MLELFAVTSSTFQLLLEVPITSCTAQPQSRSAFCFISLIKFLNLAGVLELFSVTSSTFQSLLQVPITTRTAQIHPRSALCFISLIKSLNLAGLLQYLVITSLTFHYCLSSTPQLEPQVLQTPTRHAQCITGSGWCC